MNRHLIALHQRQAKRQAAFAASPAGQAAQAAALRRDALANLQRIRVDAGIQTIMGDNPTVKPTELMRYLCRLVTPPGGVVLDPYMGSGSTIKAAELEGFDYIGIEIDPVYHAIASSRVASDAPLFRSAT